MVEAEVVQKEEGAEIMMAEEDTAKDAAAAIEHQRPKGRMAENM